jgi:hypothetical protein
MKMFRQKVKDCNSNDNNAAAYEDLDDGPPSPLAAFIPVATVLADPIDVEISKFCLLKSSKCRLEYKDVQEFWSKNSSEYPHISKLARKILCVSSTAPSERLMSLMGRNVTKTRSSLKASTVSSLVTMRNLTKFCKLENIEMPEPTSDEDEENPEDEETAQDVE